MKNDITQKPILSISMLISGRDEMEKSLKSLQPFKEAFPCEVILVDTGCNEEQRTLAERYADKVVDFAWCDDFAAARNAGLSEAGGEWFLYLDDDEWFDDPKEIIAFFTSGEYRKYGCADYVVRNYRDQDGSMYDDGWVTRMMRLGTGARFVGRIHEYLRPLVAPKKVFTDFAHHYGYVYKDDEERRRHAERNIKPLKELMQENPEKVRWVMQLVQEYVAIDEFEKAADACKEWITKYGKVFNETREKGLNHPRDLGCLYCFWILSLYSMERSEDALACVEEALEEPVLKTEEMGPAVAYIHLHGALICKALGRYEDCCRHFRFYLKYKKKLENDPVAMMRGGTLIVTGTFQKHNLYPAIIACMEPLIRTGEEKLAKKAFYILDWSDEKLRHGEEWEGRVLDACCDADYSKTWVGMLQTLVSREGGMQEMHGVFLTTERKYKQAGETEKLQRLRRFVSELEYDHYYILYTKIIVKAGKLEGIATDGQETREDRKIRKEIESLFTQLFKNHPDRLMEIPSEAWDVAGKLNIPMESLLLGVDYRTWKDGLEVWNKISAVKTMRRWEDRAAAWKKTSDIRYNVLQVKCAEGILLRYWEKGEENKEDKENRGKTGLLQWEEILWKYADGMLALNGSLYRETVLEEIPEILPDEMWIALYLKKLKACRENGDDKGALSALRKCLGVSKLLEKPLEAYAETLKEDIQKRQREAEAEKDELSVLVKTLKTTAKLRMERGEYQTAKEILRQIQACAPGDKEVGEMLKKMGGGTCSEWSGNERIRRYIPDVKGYKDSNKGG